MPRHKLPLSIAEDVVRRAKRLARQWDTTVSSLVEESLRGLTGEREESIPPRLRVQGHGPRGRGPSPAGAGPSPPDFEDAVRVGCAEKMGADVIMTRSASDFRGTDLAVRSPSDLLARLGDWE